MNVQQIFDLGVKLAIQADPRGKKGIEKYFKDSNYQVGL